MLDGLSFPLSLASFSDPALGHCFEQNPKLMAPLKSFESLHDNDHHAELDILDDITSRIITNHNGFQSAFDLFQLHLTSMS